MPGKDQTIVTGNGGPSGTGKRPVGESILPPPVFIQDIIHSSQSKTSGRSGIIEERSTTLIPSDIKSEDAVLVADTKLLISSNQLSSNGIQVGIEEVITDSTVFTPEDNIDDVGAEDRFVLFNGIATCAMFPVPVSSFSSNVWDLIISSSKEFPNKKPYESIGIPFSDLLDLTLPPVDATNLKPWAKMSDSSFSRGLEPQTVSGHTSGPVLSKSSSIIALKQLFPGVNMNVVPSSAGSS